MNEWSKIVLLYFSKVFQSLTTGVGVPLLRTGWWWWSCEFTCVTIKGENGVPTTKSNGCVSAPHGSFERYNIIGQSHSYLGFHDTVLPGSHPSFLTTAPCPLLFTTFSLPFSSSLLTTGIHKGSVLDSWSSLSPCTPLVVSSIPVYYSQFSHFGLPPKQQFCKTTFHRHLRSIIFETELKNLKQLFLLISYCEGTVPPFVR